MNDRIDREHDIRQRLSLTDVRQVRTLREMARKQLAAYLGDGDELNTRLRGLINAAIESISRPLALHALGVKNDYGTIEPLDRDGTGLLPTMRALAKTALDEVVQQILDEELPALRKAVLTSQRIRERVRDEFQGQVRRMLEETVRNEAKAVLTDCIKKLVQEELRTLVPELDQREALDRLGAPKDNP